MRALLDGNRRFDDRDRTLQKRSLKATHISWLAKAVQPDWIPEAYLALVTALQSVDPSMKVPLPGYRLETQEAIFWVNMHRLTHDSIEFACSSATRSFFHEAGVVSGPFR